MRFILITGEDRRAVDAAHRMAIKSVGAEHVGTVNAHVRTYQFVVADASAKKMVKFAKAMHADPPFIDAVLVRVDSEDPTDVEATSLFDDDIFKALQKEED